MKKILVLCLVLAMTIAYGTVSMAKTLDVNVDEGYSVLIEKENTDAKPINVNFNIGINDQFLMSLGYQTESKGYNVGLRYEFIENLAATVDFCTYRDSNLDELSLGLRGKLNFTDNLALTGNVEYIKTDDNDGYGALCQVEWKLAELLTANLGAKYDEFSDNTYFVAGLEVYPMEGVAFWGDYSVDSDNSDDNYFGVGIELSWK